MCSQLFTETGFNTRHLPSREKRLQISRMANSSLRISYDSAELKVLKCRLDEHRRPINTVQRLSFPGFNKRKQFSVTRSTLQTSRAVCPVPFSLDSSAGIPPPRNNNPFRGALTCEHRAASSLRRVNYAG